MRLQLKCELLGGNVVYGKNVLQLASDMHKRNTHHVAEALVHHALFFCAAGPSWGVSLCHRLLKLDGQIVIAAVWHM